MAVPPTPPPHWWTDRAFNVDLATAEVLAFCLAQGDQQSMYYQFPFFYGPGRAARREISTRLFKTFHCRWVLQQQGDWRLEIRRKRMSSKSSLHFF